MFTLDSHSSQFYKQPTASTAALLSALDSVGLEVRVPAPVPSGLLVEEPSVAHPEEAVEEPEKNGGISGAKTSGWS